jgi:TM2 domain-containing membrane protein YozV
MRGQVLGVDLRTGDGIVTGDDGRRYSFKPRDWAYRGEPAVGMYVDFEPEESRALSIFPVPGTTALHAQPEEPENDRNKYIAAALAFFLGPLGIHRFYLGRTGTGILMVALSCTIVGLLVTGLWAFIDAVRFLIMSDREFANRYGRED